MDSLKPENVATISFYLRQLSEILSKRDSSLHLALAGSPITDKLQKGQLGLLEAVREDYVRRLAAPILIQLRELGAPVDVGFDYDDYVEEAL